MDSGVKLEGVNSRTSTFPVFGPEAIAWRPSQYSRTYSWMASVARPGSSSHILTFARATEYRRLRTKVVRADFVCESLILLTLFLLYFDATQFFVTRDVQDLVLMVP